MKHKFSLILFSALLSTTFAWAQDATAFYQLPAGVFLSGMTDDGDVAPAELHAPHISGKTYTFTSEINGKWQSGSADSKTYTLTSTIMKAYKIPHLTVGESKYQYGSKNGAYTANSYFYVGDSVMRSMTPAKLYGAGGTTPYTTSTYYKTTDKDTIGVYFNNIGMMYIDSISIPITNKDGAKNVEEIFPEGAHVIVNIFKATSAGGKGENTLDRKTRFYTDTLTRANYKFRSTKDYIRGALNKKFSKPISIDGPFVIELRDMKHSGCSFSIYCSTERTNENLWGYYFSKGSRSFPNNLTPLISVHAMFPVLEKQDAEQTLEFASAGGEDEAAIISNINPKSEEDFTVDFGGADWISTKDITNADDYKTSGKSTLTFEAKPNTTGKTREATITLKHHGKELKYTVSQESMLSAFYELPANAFFAGMTETGDTAAECKTFYLPYNYGQEYTFTSTEAGDWTSSEEGTPDETNKNYSYSNRTMKDSCHTPLFAVEGKVGYQYGASGESFDENLYFHIGDSVMHYMTPARLYGEYGKPTHYLSGNYKTTNYDTVGVYFNNEDVMYIDGISIPIKNGTAATANDMFPTDNAHVIVNIYKATSAGGKGENKVDRKIQFYTDTLTKGDFKVHSEESNRGTLNKTFEKPISIEGPFVIELTDVKHSGCAFTVYSSTERTDENMWGYFFNEGKRTFPGNYTPLISVHAMFPVLYEKSEEDLTIDTIPATGSTFGDKDCPTRTIYANVKYNKLDEDGWSREHKVSGVKMDFYKNDRTEESTKWYFVMSPNTSGAVREGDIIFNLRGKKLAYHVTQAAPTLTPREGMGNEQKFEIPLQDDTVHINGNKVTKVYLESEVSLKDAIKVVSKKGLTKIDTTFESENGKYYVCLTFTRAKYVPTDTEDIITVSFKGNSKNKYEYTIHHEGAGELTTSHDYRTIVFGPQGSRRGLFVNDKGELQKDYFINIQAKIPAKKFSYIANQDRFYDTGFAFGGQGTANEYLQVCPKTKSNTETVLKEDLRILIPNVDTITFHLIQEAKARVWQLYGDTYNEMEVNNKGGNAHFKNSTETVMTLFSNTQVTTGDIDITFTSETDKSWVQPSIVIKPSSTLTKDTVLVTFEVAKLDGIEPRSTDMKITVLGTLFTIPLTQKAFGIKLSHEGTSDTLVVPVAGGMALWKGTNNPNLYVDGTEAYPDNLLKVTVPDGVTPSRYTSIGSTGLPRTTFTFVKTGTVTKDWSDSIFISFDSINDAEQFEYRFRDTIIITQAAPAPEPTPYTRTVTADNWGTICLPYASKSFSGAEMYSIAGKMEGDDGIYLDQVEKMEAGVPYIFKATADEIKVVYAAGEPQKADTVNGLYGYIGESDKTIDPNAGNYIVYNNALYFVDSDGVTIASNRAYIKYSEVGTTPSPAPQVRRVAMPINGAPANMLQVSDTKQPVKILRDGHIVILRADKEYDILGQSK